MSELWSDYSAALGRARRRLMQEAVARNPSVFSDDVHTLVKDNDYKDAAIANLMMQNLIMEAKLSGLDGADVMVPRNTLARVMWRICRRL